MMIVIEIYLYFLTQRSQCRVLLFWKNPNLDGSPDVTDSDLNSNLFSLQTVGYCESHVLLLLGNIYTFSRARHGRHGKRSWLGKQAGVWVRMGAYG